MRTAILLLGLLSSPALAQTTTCQVIGNTVTCNTPPPPPPLVLPSIAPSGGGRPLPPGQLLNPADVGRSVSNGFHDGMRRAQEMRLRQAEIEALRASSRPVPPPAAATSQSYRDGDVIGETRSGPPATAATEFDSRMVGSLLKDERCDDAIKYALDRGKIDLATQAQTFCFRMKE